MENIKIKLLAWVFNKFDNDPEFQYWQTLDEVLVMHLRSQTIPPNTINVTPFILSSNFGNQYMDFWKKLNNEKYIEPYANNISHLTHKGIEKLLTGGYKWDYIKKNTKGISLVVVFFLSVVGAANSLAK